MKGKIRKCRECLYIEEEDGDPDYTKSDYYTCMRYPPETSGYYSKTKSYWSCGEFKQRGGK